MSTFRIILSGIALAGGAASWAVPAAAATTFLAHFDSNSYDIGADRIDADYAVGSALGNSLGGDISTSQFKFADGSYDVGGSLQFDTAGNFNVSAGTIEMWFKSDLWADNQFNGFFGTFGSGQPDIRMQKTNAQRIEAYMYNGGKIWYVETPANLVVDTNWHHLAWDWDLSTNTSALYLDGVVVSNNLTGNFTPTSDLDYLGSVPAKFQVGAVGAGSAQFQGFIDELRISNVALYNGADFSGNLPTAPYPIPEPASLGLLGLLGASLMSRCRR
jgi:hypothetical protein